MFVRGHREFSNSFIGNGKSAAKFFHHPVAFDGELCTRGSGSIMNAAMDDTAIARAGAKGQISLFLNHQHVEMGPREFPGDGIAYDAGPYDGDIMSFHGPSISEYGHDDQNELNCCTSFAIGVRSGHEKKTQDLDHRGCAV